MGLSTPLAERIRERMPTVRQLAAAAEIVDRATGSDSRQQLKNALAKFDGETPLAERLDAEGLTEVKLFGTIATALDAKRTDKADHAIRLKATRTGLELRGLLSSRGGVSVAASGNCQVNVGLSWSPAPSQVLDSNSVPSSQHSSQHSLPSTTTSTSEGTGIGRGGAPHGRPIAKSSGSSSGMMVGIPIAEMSTWQLKKYVPAAERRMELDRRKKLRARKNPRVRRSNKGQSNCKSGKCGRCNKCRLEKRRIATDENGKGVYAK